MLVVNRAGEIVAANQQATKLYGYSREHLIGRVVESLIPARLRDRHRQHRENFFANPEKQAMQVIEIFAVRSDASEIPVDVSLSLLTIGTETFSITAVRDATERRRLKELKRGEAVLREKKESEERFRLAAQAGKMYAYEWDVATDLVVRSEEQLNVLGFSQPRQLTRQELLARVHPEDRALFVASVDQLTPQYPTMQISYRVLRPDGSIVWLEKNARGFFDEQGKLLRVIGMVANITERKQAEEAVRESEEKFRSVFRDAGVGMVIVSPEGRFLAANGTFCDCLGYTEEELLAKTVESVTFPEDWPAFSHKLGEAITEGFGLWQFKKRCVHKSGRIVYTESSASLIRNRNGEPQYFVGGVLDVTKRKESEDALAEMTRKLIQAQEQERARIGRELHDDINQRLAMLAVELEQLQDNPSEIRSRVQELRKQTTEISNDVQALSHELHSSKLEYLGVVGGMKSWCKEFGERQGIQIDFKSTTCRASVHRKSGFAFFEFYKKPCTMQPSTAG